ncbi:MULTISPECIES: hypothetical protein [Streptomyces]|uniref:Uncharacterized protein n=1 Tax=Streptomyces fradiae ATCC 10745 = DSM 40063 TaxID=1319510 RepID=A0A1Y2NQ25_STRFR|nr:MULTISPECIES: hypothetical protein [Streptomyces]KAF0646574.1 hypothetical protein K701_27890 [Streptomyces fradiae ATCC 10745 = DSM 40063]OSY49209.1 hypothetical protein BG846_05187 [Streptomyces fradiae ATCC 10745 = DSM 40063]
MSGMSARERGDLAEKLLPVAALLATYVRGEGGPEDVQRVLDDLDDTARAALIVVLAGLVDPDQTVGAALGWLNFDEEGRLRVPDWGNRTRLRELADDVVPIASVRVDEVVVERRLAGDKCLPMTRAERRLAVERGVRRGMGYDDLAELLGMTRTAVKRSWERTKERRGETGRRGATGPVRQLHAS